MPLIATRGASSVQGFGQFAQSGPVNYIEDMFSTFLYTGTGSAQTITNNIDLSTKGGLVWIKNRSAQDFGNTRAHWLFDSARTAGNSLASNNTNAENTAFAGSIPFSTTGFSINTGDANLNGTGTNPYTYVGWTFRKQPKFFDVVTFTADLSNANQRISHNLGSVPGTIIIKCTNIGGSFSDWWTYHRSLGRSAYLKLNATTASTSSTNFWGTSDPTSTDFGFNAFDWGLSGGTYVAYLFAHDAGGFGLTGLDNVISCGSYTGNGSATGPTVTLGYEPQWLLIKRAVGGTAEWVLNDNMRGIATGGTDAMLHPNLTDAEYQQQVVDLTSTGFVPMANQSGTNASGSTYIYIAIRRGPMKVPTDGTKVFTPATRTGDGATSVNVTNATFPVDLVFGRGRAASAATPTWIDRLRGATVQLRSDNTDAEAASTIMSSLASQTGWIGSTGGSGSWNTPSVNYIQWYFKRAPGFFDEVCYTGTGVNRTVTHNLGVAPELMITKSRSFTYDWAVYAAGIGNTKYGLLNDAGQFYVDSSAWNDTSPTSSVFTVGTGTYMNGSGNTYVAYLFATCAGVSKVGSYTGTATTLQIDCGFTAGARFVLIKRTDSTGDWYVWDTVRGIIAGNDPYLLLNSTAAEVTNTDYIDSYSPGFELSSTAPAAINANGGTYIFLAIA